MMLALARWRSGDVTDCKSVNPGSIPGRASRMRNQRVLPLGRVFPYMGSELVEKPLQIMQHIDLEFVVHLG